jgi:hypothetical protein
MTGPEIKAVRTTLGHDPYVFAKILGVHLSTLYRWERSSGEAHIDPLQAEILDRLRTNLAAREMTDQRKLGDDVLKAVLIGGTLTGLTVLLNQIVNSDIRGNERDGADHT